LTHPLSIAYGCWLLALLVVEPVGEFPLNDDWAYALSVKNWLETGQFGIIDWPAMSLFAQIVWGTAWAKVFGFSFTILRVSTLVLAGIALGCFERVLTDLAFSAWQRTLVLLTIIFNPLFFHLAASFMTDVPFLSCCLLASYGYWRYFKAEHWAWGLFALTGCVAAILIRQLGLLLPVAFGMAAVLYRPNWRSIAFAIAGVLVTYGSLQVFLWYLDQTSGIPSTFASIDSVLPLLQPGRIWRRSQQVMGFYPLYLGGYLLPLTVCALKWRAPASQLLPFLLSIPLVGYYVWLCWDRLPLWNTIYDWGIGPVSLPDFVGGHSLLSVLSSQQGLALKLTAALGALLLLWTLAGGVRRGWPKLRQPTAASAFKLGVVFFLGSYLFYLQLNPFNFDRYMLPLLVFTTFLLPRFSTRNSWRSGIALVALLPLALFSTAGTHDYFAWTRVRWQALAALESEGVFPNEIDGGFEYNGWHQTHHRNPRHGQSKSWWYVDQDRYAIAFSPFKDYRVKSTHPFHRYLTWGQDTVLVLERPAFAEVMTIQHPHAAPAVEPYVRFDITRFQQLLPGAAPTSNYQLTRQQAFGFDHLLFPVQPYEQISVAMRILGNTEGFLLIMASPDEEDFYFAHPPYVVETDQEDWQQVSFELELPATYPSDSLKIYLWKNQPEDLFIDQFEITWQKHEAGYQPPN
ncbi:MAG: hypothetical protein AAF840_10075, partial [Bacteroidota bacterium]